MIGTLIAMALAAAGGFAAGRGRGIMRELERRAAAESTPRIVPIEGVPVVHLDAYRDPAPSVALPLPSDREDFEQLNAAMCASLVTLAGQKQGQAIIASELRDEFLSAIYPDFQWPPVPNDHSSARLMWIFADYEAHRVLALETCSSRSFAPTMLPKVTEGKPARARIQGP
jgi:hypothetical protein